GKSSRMKRDKAFLQIGEKTFVENAARILAPVCRQIKIVLNKSQTHFTRKLPENTQYIFDIYENRGALGGIHAALSDCQSGWAIILAVDLQLVTDEAIENLARIAFESKDFAAVVPIQMDGRPQPLCAVYRVEDCLPKLGNLLKEPTSASVRDFLKLVPTRFIGQDELATNGREDLFFNVNRPSDFQNLID
ncbi:MAG TPA: molybdenum cofactor guanylyltransferase, partial [Pyrinomonadaceae bacterium]|nr:molybdenum cofactor guanylyltransferase [Pyrinomonadaceae bacterium]